MFFTHRSHTALDFVSCLTCTAMRGGDCEVIVSTAWWNKCNGKLYYWGRGHNHSNLRNLIQTDPRLIFVSSSACLRAARKWAKFEVKFLGGPIHAEKKTVWSPHSPLFFPFYSLKIDSFSPHALFSSWLTSPVSPKLGYIQISLLGNWSPPSWQVQANSLWRGSVPPDPGSLENIVKKHKQI